MEKTSTLVKEYPTLYIKSFNNKKLYYKIRIFELHNIFTILSSFGELYGKEKTSKTIVKTGKNLFKSNSTTPYEQACAEAASLQKEKYNDGYRVKDEYLTLNAFFELYFPKDYPPQLKDINDRVKPMLAQKFKKEKFPFYIQPKLNGIRALAHHNITVQDNTSNPASSSIGSLYNLTLTSREGIQVNNPIIESQALVLLNTLMNNNSFSFNIVLDGELYIHKTPLNEIVKVSRANDLITQSLLSYIIYDVIIMQNGKVLQIKQNDRLQVLKLLNNIIKENKEYYKNVNILRTHTVHNEEELMYYHKEFLNLKYEGSIIRPKHELYYAGHRAKSLQKFKVTQSQEYVIRDIILPPSGEAKDCLLVCLNEQDFEFNVRPHGLEEDRISMYNNKNLFIGKKVTLTFFEKSKNNFPFHITEVVVRDYE